jgi:hypothetical protein
VLLFAGLDRFDNSGDATAGFWFFQNPVGLSTSNPTSSGSPFTGTHKDGDILLVSDFTQGGSTSTITVYRWTGDDATGSLVQVAAPGTTTFAIVNSGSVAVPWSFTDKSHRTSPAAGEFLEEGVDLTALGLGGCFSNFLAETRSSQSPTATLSDFVIGNFNTCRLDLPNTATVQADGIPPITSNQVVITVVDGHAEHATSPGSGAGADSLTAEQLQAAVAQGIRAWASAGVDARTLSNLDQVRVHLGNLPGAELGFSAGGEIWIDQTAAGWGWSTGSTPVAGRMDLVTVVTHELGHVLGFEHSDAGVMEAALAPGVQRVPEALPGTGSVVAAVAAPVSAGAAAGTSSAIAPGAVHVGELNAPLSTRVHMGTVETALATAARDAVVLPASSSTGAVEAVFTAVARGLTPVEAVVPAGRGSQAGVPLELTMLAPTILSAVVTVPAAVSTRTDRGTASGTVPGLWPPGLRTESGKGAALEDRAGEQAGPSSADPQLWERASDSCFAGDSQATDLADTLPMLQGHAPVAGAAAVALALSLAGWRSAWPTDIEPRRRQRFLIDRS